MADSGKKPPRKGKHLNVRIDDDLYDAASERAKPYGGLSVVVRALLSIFASGERQFDPEDIARAAERAPKPPRKTRKSKSQDNDY